MCDFMPVYSGNAFKQFVIDRLALGFSTSQIKAEFERTQKLEIDESEISVIVHGCDDDIKRRESELIQELRSQDLVSSLHKIKDQLDEAREIARKDGDLKTYASLTNTSLKNIEILISLVENLKRKSEIQIVSIAQNNLYTIQVLEDDGILKVLDHDKLKNIFISEKEKGRLIDGNDRPGNGDIEAFV